MTTAPATSFIDRQHIISQQYINREIDRLAYRALIVALHAEMSAASTRLVQCGCPACIESRS